MRPPIEPPMPPQEQVLQSDAPQSPAGAPPSSTLAPAHLLRLVLSGWWIVLLVLLMTIVAATYTTLQRPRVYRSYSTFAVAPSDTVLGSREATINSINVLDRRTIPNTFAEIARSRSILEVAGVKAGFAEADLQAVRSSAVVLPETFVVRITVEADDSNKAAVLANSLLAETSSYALQSYPSYQARPLDQAIPTVTPASPQPLRDIGAAAIVGLVLGCVVASVVQYLRAPASERAARGDRRRRGLRQAGTR